MAAMSASKSEEAATGEAAATRPGSSRPANGERSAMPSTLEAELAEAGPASTEVIAGIALRWFAEHGVVLVAGKLAPADCERIGGHAFSRTGYVTATQPARYLESCRYCGSTRYAVPRDPFEYVDYKEPARAQ